MPISAKPKNCRVCGKPFIPIRSTLEPVCANYECRTEFALRYTEKQREKKAKIERKKPIEKKQSSPISKVSKKRKIEQLQYSVLRTEFLSKKENQICPITKKQTTDIHHKKGRIGDLLLDTKYWVALSREGHKYVEDNPIWAKENGYSLSRLSND